MLAKITCQRASWAVAWRQIGATSLDHIGFVGQGTRVFKEICHTHHQDPEHNQGAKGLPLVKIQIHLEDQLNRILAEVSAYSAKLIAVSKTKPISEIQRLYDMGHRRFGENRVQELLEKQNALPPDIEWHLIGHLQRNKVKQVLGAVHMIHAVDSLRLLEEITKQSNLQEREIRILIQIKIAQEDSKYGLTVQEAPRLLEYAATNGDHVRICGLMGMATFTDNLDQVRSEFQQLNKHFQLLKLDENSTEDFTELSMGMSGDYPLALEEGSTMVRIGSLLFGPRVYDY